MSAATPPQRVAVLGAGAWGTALALHISRNGYPVCLWAHHADHAAAMAETGSNPRFLPEIRFPDTLSVTADLAKAVGSADIVLVVVPSHAFRQTLAALRPLLKPQQWLAWATKGLEFDSQKLLHQVAAEELGEAVAPAVISGPTFAREVARGLPGAITVASTDATHAERIAEILHNERFRAYTAGDVVGVELGGALKNVLAIAAGIADGLGFGANTRAALITRGLHEIMRLGHVLGGQAETFMGLAGLGDLILTCTDDQSRNRRFGLGVGQGRDRDEVIAEIGEVVEGIKSAAAAHALATRHEVDMPITEQVYRVLYEGEDPHDAVRDLLDREVKPETV